MKLSHVIAMLAILVCTSFGEDTIWAGVDGVGHCRTGGSWWSFADHDSTSLSNFPTASSTSDTIGAWIAANGGMIDITYTLQHSANGYAYYGIGFNFVDPEQDTPQKWTNICLDYSLTGTAPVELQLKNYSELTHDNDYAVRLKSQAVVTKTCFARSDFKQPGPNRTDNTVFPIDTLMSVLRGIKLEATTGAIPIGIDRTSELKLISITTNTDPSSVRRNGGQNKMHLIQTANILYVVGVSNNSTTLELVSVEGQVMLWSRLSAGQPLEVHDMPAGVYTAIVQNGSDSFSQRIALLP